MHKTDPTRLATLLDAIWKHMSRSTPVPRLGNTLAHARSCAPRVAVCLVRGQWASTAYDWQQQRLCRRLAAL